MYLETLLTVGLAVSLEELSRYLLFAGGALETGLVVDLAKGCAAILLDSFVACTASTLE